MRVYEIHGMRNKPEYRIWDTMIQRCTNPNNEKFVRYGARGIKVCKSWKDSFKAFFSDMGSRPSSKHSIERKDNNGNYSASNCVWATANTQARNSSKVVLSPAKAIAIRQLYNNGAKNYQIAKLFGLTQDLTHQVIKNKIWKAETL